MINTPTVLILGAGASAPYGFPSGSTLKDKICDNLSLLTNDASVELQREGFTKDEIRKFRTDLHGSATFSVDAFLERRREYENVGKAAIVQVLMPLENKDALHGDWYEHLFNKLCIPFKEGFEDFDKNKISILTYNYDRSLEQFLMTALKSNSGKEYEECVEKLSKIPIVHLHGKMGDLLYKQGVASRREYDTRLDEGDISRFSRGIKIIHEDINNDPEFKQAHDLISGAKRVYFLGFGYDPMNLERLKLTPDSFNRTYGTGTAYKKSSYEVREIHRMLGGGFEVPDTEWDTLKLLKEHGI